MYDARNPWYDAEIEYRAQRIKDGTTGPRGTSPRSARRRRATRNDGSWETWRSPRLAD